MKPEIAPADYTPESITAEKATRMAVAAMTKDWEAMGYANQQEYLDTIPERHQDKLDCIEGMLGGLALMRVGAEHGDGWILDGMEDALSEHFDKIEMILEEGRKVYAENVSTMKKAIA